MTKASKQALTDPVNQDTRWTHRQIVFNALKGCQLTYPEIAAKVRLKPDKVWKRASDMEKEDILIIVGQKEGITRPHSIYAQNPNPPDISKKKPSFEKWARKKKHSAWFEYRAEIHHEI